jgi:hypothetical protein
MLSDSSLHRSSFLGELVEVIPSRTRSFFVLDTRSPPNRAFRPFWENAFPYTYFSEESRAKLIEHLGKELSGVVAI